MFGALVIDKPSGWTSHDVVAKMRRLAGTKRIGHLGTLDPMATGVLPLLLGPATRMARFFDREEKIYEGVVRFGFSTSTYDAEGDATSEEQPFAADADALTDLIAQRFLGAIAQVPPAISAKKIGGTPAYKLARQNKPVVLEPVAVTVHEFRILAAEGPRITVRVRCTPGTYVRSLAHDLGSAVGVGAHLEKLRRLASGSFSIGQAITMEEATELSAAGKLSERMIPAAELLPHWPMEIVNEVTAGQIREGRDFNTSPFLEPNATPWVKALSPEGLLVAIGERKLHCLYHPTIVFPHCSGQSPS